MILGRVLSEDVFVIVEDDVDLRIRIETWEAWHSVFRGESSNLAMVERFQLSS